MRNTSTIEVLGNLTSKPEIQTSKDGKTEFLKVNLAVNIAEDKVNFYTLVAFNGLSKLMANNFDKGQLLLVSGDFEIEEYTTKEGEKRNSYKIIVKRALAIQKIEKDEDSIDPNEIPID